MMDGDRVPESANLLRHPSQENINQVAVTRSRRIMNLCVVLLVVFVVSIGIFVSSSPFYGPKRNVILMISDGFGPASETYGRLMYQYLNNATFHQITPLDKILVGQSRTRSSSSSITDSAAGATAFSCAVKSYNGAIAVDSQKKPCGTVLEAAKRQGYLTGLVATSRITHATPAAFSSHVPYRDMEDEIAEHQLGFYPLGRNVDLLLGGGLCSFLPSSRNGSCRLDDRDLIKEGTSSGWNFAYSPEQLAKASDKLPLAGLFSLNHMDYDIDRDSKYQPSLKEMAQSALNTLTRATKKSSKGFFLMIEGSRIDMGAHSNDPVAHAHEILAYYQAIEVVKKYVEENSDTVMISVSDHETGGFTIGRQLTPAYPPYNFFPEVIAKVKHSSVHLSNMIHSYQGKDKSNYIHSTIVQELMGIKDATPQELKVLESELIGVVADGVSNMVSKRAYVGWTTHGHTGVDVNLYAAGAHYEGLIGNKENTDIGKFIEKFMGTNVEKVTRKLSKWKQFKELAESINPLNLVAKDPNSASHH